MSRPPIATIGMIVVLLVAIVVPVVTFGAGGQLIQGEPDLDVHVPEPSLQPGVVNEVVLQISNTGSVSTGAPEARDAVTTARNVRVEVDADDTPISVRSGQQAIGSVGENEPGTATVRLAVPRDIDPGTYDLDVTLRFSYSSTISQASGVTQELSRTVTRTVEVSVDDGARFELNDVSSDVQIGGTGTITASLENFGNEDAADVHMTLESSSSQVVFGDSSSDTVRVNSLNAGESTPVQFGVTVRPSANPREYPLDGTVRFTNHEGVETTETGLTIGFQPLTTRFVISDVDSTLQVGERGYVAGTITNAGQNQVRNAVIQVGDGGPTVIPVETAVGIGTLDAGESTSFRLPIGISDEGEAVNQVLDLSLRYQNPDSSSRRTDDVEISAVSVAQAQQFRVSDLETDNRVGEDGEILGTVINDGPAPVENVEVIFADESANVVPIEREVAVGSLAVGDGESFRLPIEVGREAEPGPKVFDLTVRYRNQDHELRTFDDLSMFVDIADRRDEFLLSIADRTVPAGSSVLLTVELTNNLDEPVTDIEGRLFTDSPLSSTDDEGYIEGLKPNETETMTFELSATQAATAKTYPVRIDFRYDDVRGNSKISETYRIAITVIEPDGSSIPWTPMGVILALHVILSEWFIRRGR